MKLEAYIVLLFKLVGGITSIQSSSSPVTPRRAAIYARAAAYHGQQRHVDPFELLALARTESDFNETAVGPDGLDCGLTQTRTTYSRYTCQQLQRSAWLAFAEAAREMSSYDRSCHGKEDYDRCRFNRYNSGTRYARKGWAGRYYLRVTCYAEAARRRLPMASYCRDIRSEDELAVRVAQAEEASGLARTVIPPPRRELEPLALGPLALAPPFEASHEDVLADNPGDGQQPLWLSGQGRPRKRARRRLRWPRGGGASRV